jgi:transcriptional regulator with XRE-family HTH domain
MVDQWKEDLFGELQDPEFTILYGADRAKSSFGLTLLKTRRALDLTQKQLAERLGVKQPYIAQVESGEINLTLEAAGKMLAVLGLKMVVSTEPLASLEKVTVSPALSVVREGK